MLVKLHAQTKTKQISVLTWPTPLVTLMIHFVYEKISGVFVLSNLMINPW